jgi:AbrB family looped-hinge helix DNA binding protein
VALAKSKLTAQGQISVPRKVQQKLGIGPGSVLEWDEQDGLIIVRKAGRYTSEEIYRVLFSTPPRARTIVEMKNSLRRTKRRRASR